MTASPRFPAAQPFDFRGASERQCALLNGFYDAVHAEQAPDDPAIPTSSACAAGATGPTL